MTLEVDALITFIRTLAGPTVKDQMLVATSRGTFEVFEPHGNPSGTWVRFKAALINVPLLNRLHCVKAAKKSMDAVRGSAQLRRDFADAIEHRFGVGIRREAMRDKAIGNGVGAKHLSARKVLKVMNRADAAAQTFAEQNSAILTKHIESLNPNGPFQSAYIRMAAITSSAYFQGVLTTNVIASFEHAASKMEHDLFEIEDEMLELRLLAMMEKYQHELAESTINRRQLIATRCLAEMAASSKSAKFAQINAKIISRYRPASLVGGDANDPLDKLVKKLCRDARGTDQENWPNLTVKQAWHTIEMVWNAISKEVLHSDSPLPVATRTHIRVALGDAARQHAFEHETISLEKLLTRTRQNFVSNALNTMIGTSLKAYLPTAIYREVGPDHHFDANALTVLVEDISETMQSEINTELHDLQERLGCEANVPSIVIAAHERFIADCKTAVLEHVYAIREISASTKLNKAQQAMLIAWGSRGETEKPNDKNNANEVNQPNETGKKTRPRRLDRVQVKQYQELSAVIDYHLKLILGTDTKHLPAQLFDSMMAILAGLNHCLASVHKYAREFWLIGALLGPEDEQMIFDLCVHLAIAGIQWSLEQRRAVLLALEPCTSNTHPTGGKALDISIDPVRQFIDVCLSATMYTGKPVMLYHDILRVMRQTAGGATNEKENIEILSLDYAKSSLPPLRTARPELLARAFTDPRIRANIREFGCTELDERGVLIEWPNAHRVKASFQPDAVPQRVVPSVHNPSQNEIDTARSRLISMRENGSILSRSGSDVDIDRPGLDAILVALERCTNSTTVDAFAADVEAASFDAPITMDDFEYVHEVSRETDGDWLIQSTRVGHPVRQNNVTLNTDGVVLHTLTHRVSSSDASAIVTIKREDARSVFAF